MHCPEGAISPSGALTKTSYQPRSGLFNIIVAALPRRGNQSRRACNSCKAAAKPRTDMGYTRSLKTLEGTAQHHHHFQLLSTECWLCLNLKCIEIGKNNGCGAALPRRGNQPRRGCNCCEAAAKPRRGVGDAAERLVNNKVKM